MRSKAPPVIMCPFLPCWPTLRVPLKRGVTRMSMIACYSYDTVLFLIFAVNIAFHVEQDLSSIEFGLLISCVIFAFLFEIIGRRRIFTMRLLITSVFSFMVAFGWWFQQWWLLSWLEFFNWQTTAFTMCSVSLSVPFIADFVKFKKRGLAYSYTALDFTFCLVLILSIVNLDTDQRIEKEWFFGFTSVLGFVTAGTMFWFWSDKQEFMDDKIKKKVPACKFIKDRLTRVLKSALKNLKRDNQIVFICASWFVINSVIFSVFFVNYEDVVEQETFTDIVSPILVIMLIPSVFYTGLKADKKSPWGLLMIQYWFLIAFMVIFALQGASSNHWLEEIPKVIGFAGTATAAINIFMMNMIIVSKSVSRECRAFFLGISFAFGALGAYISLT